MRRKLLGLSLWCGCAAGCAPGSAVTPGFVDDDVGAGPRVVLEAEAEADGARASARVVAKELGPVFGLSYHLTWDDEVLDVELAQPDFLGQPSLMLARAGAGDAALGGTRRDTAAGAVALDDTVLLELTLAATSAGASRLALESLAVRTIDGGWVAAAAGGGELTLVAPEE